MLQSIVHIALVVKDYDEAIEFYTKKLNFTLVEDSYQPEQNIRWVVVSPPGSVGTTTILLARASKPEQEPFIGNQSGGMLGRHPGWETSKIHTLARLPLNRFTKPAPASKNKSTMPILIA